MTFGTLCWFAFVAMIIGFNVFVGGIILELQRDVQIIRKRLGIEAKKKAGSRKRQEKKDETSLSSGSRREDPDRDDSDTDSEAEQEQEKRTKKD